MSTPYVTVGLYRVHQKKHSSTFYTTRVSIIKSIHAKNPGYFAYFVLVKMKIVSRPCFLENKVYQSAHPNVSLMLKI